VTGCNDFFGYLCKGFLIFPNNVSIGVRYHRLLRASEVAVEKQKSQFFPVCFTHTFLDIQRAEDISGSQESEGYFIRETSSPE
jgi:hypothetical protein